MTKSNEPPNDAGDGSRPEAAIAKEPLDGWLDQALDATFPASDPVASPPASPKADQSAAERDRA